MRYLVLLGAIVSLYGIAFYLRDIFRGTTKPNLVTWVLWVSTAWIAVAAELASGVRWAVVPVFMTGFGPFLIIVAALIKKNAAWQLHVFDYVCGGLSILAIILWLTTKQPTLAVLFVILGDALAFIPTLKKAWRYPETETGIAYTTAVFNMVTTFFAVQHYTLIEAAFPLYSVLVNLSGALVVYRKKIFKFHV